MTQDYLAICFIGWGGSSYGRASTREKAVAICKDEVVGTWSHLFDLNGKEVPINVYDVTGNDQVRWDDCGIYGDKEAEFPIKTLEVERVTLKVKKRRR